MTDNQISPKMDCHGPANVGKLVAEQPSDTNDDRPNITNGLAQLSEAAEAVQRMRSEKEDGGGQVFRHTGARLMGLVDQSGGEIDRLMDDNLSKYSLSKPPYQTRSVTTKAKLLQTQTTTHLDNAARIKAKEDLEEAQKRYDALSSPTTPDISLVDVPNDGEEERQLQAHTLPDNERIVSSHHTSRQNANSLMTSTALRPTNGIQQPLLQESPNAQQIRTDQVLAQQLAADYHTKYINKNPTCTTVPCPGPVVTASNAQVMTLQQEVIELQKQILISNQKSIPIHNDAYHTAVSEFSSDSESDCSSIASVIVSRDSRKTKVTPNNSTAHSLHKSKAGSIFSSSGLESDDSIVSRSKRKGKENINRRPSRRVGHHLKLIQYDGTSCLETFVIQFKTCSDYNRWNESEKLAQLKMALKEGALNVLLGNADNLTFEGIM